MSGTSHTVRFMFILVAHSIGRRKEVTSTILLITDKLADVRAAVKEPQFSEIQKAFKFKAGCGITLHQMDVGTVYTAGLGQETIWGLDLKRVGWVEYWYDGPTLRESAYNAEFGPISLASP